MRVLLAEDDNISRRILEAALEKHGYDVVIADDGDVAWNMLQEDSSPQLVILDWVMPGKDGVEICRLIRNAENRPVTYIILLTGKGRAEDIVEGLAAGADDYITKPFNREELLARVKVGERIVTLQSRLQHHVRELEEAIEHIRTLQGILPICSYCKKIREDSNYWRQLESYITRHYSGLQFSHSVCPDCYEKYVKPQIEAQEDKRSPEAQEPPEVPPQEN